MLSGKLKAVAQAPPLARRLPRMDSLLLIDRALSEWSNTSNNYEKRSRESIWGNETLAWRSESIEPALTSCRYVHSNSLGSSPRTTRRHRKPFTHGRPTGFQFSLDHGPSCKPGMAARTGFPDRQLGVFALDRLLLVRPRSPQRQQMACCCCSVEQYSRALNDSLRSATAAMAGCSGW